MMRVAVTAVVASLTLASPALARTVFCAPVAVAEQIGESGPLTISASNPDFGNPVVFWLDSETGAYQEHFDEGSTFISGEATLEIRSVDPFVAYNAKQSSTLKVDFIARVHSFHELVEGTLASIGTCVDAPMGQIPAEDAAPIWPFPYKAGR